MSFGVAIYDDVAFVLFFVGFVTVGRRPGRANLKRDCFAEVEKVWVLLLHFAFRADSETAE